MSHSIAEQFGRQRHNVRDGQDTSNTNVNMVLTSKTPQTPSASSDVSGVSTQCNPITELSRPSTDSQVVPAIQVMSPPEDLPQIQYPKPFLLRLPGHDCTVKFWDGEHIAAAYPSIDAETEVIQGQEIPRLAMLTACAGDEHYIIHYKDVVRFIEAHATAHWVFFNIAFDFWVLHRYLSDHGRADLVTLLWDKVARNELHDVMLLDTLLGLARRGTADRRNLAEVAADYVPGIALNKEDPYRLRYGELLERDWTTADAGFFVYAIKDAIATNLVDRALRPLALQLAQTWSAWLWADAVDRFGPLSEAVQIKGAIALAAAGREGLRQDREAIARLEGELSEKMRRLESQLLESSPSPDLVKRNKSGEIVRTKTGLPSLKQKVLQGILENIVGDERTAGLPPVPRNTDGSLSEAEEHWLPFAPRFPLIDAWLELERCGKKRQFAVQPTGERVHPRYNVLKRTGRTSAEGPNLHQVPREGGFRECYIPTSGYYYMVMDYKFIELVTLAAICELRFGFSRLAEVIRNGIDPHCFTAALITGMPLDAFMALKLTDPDRFKDLRQKAKALNFGIPGGMGGTSLMEYAQANYGVILTLEQASEWREKVISEIYPELALYLADRTIAALAANLYTTEEALWAALQEDGSRPEWMAVCVRKILYGICTKKDGSPYNPSFLDRVWSALVRICRRTELLPALMARQAGPGLAALCNESAATPTGRIRSGVGYTEAHNTPFQGLASDGAKLACFELVRAGYRLVGFVHDEFIIEVPIEANHTEEAKRVEQIVCDGMGAAINGAVPVGVEFALSTCWSKGAKAIYDKQGRLMPWSPKQTRVE